MIGLNISASFNSAITIYIIIPLLVIPMMVLSGAMFSFDKLNRTIGSVEKVPVIAELMPTRWTYEALMVSQFKDNKYSKTEFTRDGETYYSLQKKISESDFNKVYRIPELRKALYAAQAQYIKNPRPTGEDLKTHSDRLELMRNELGKIGTMYDLPAFSETGSVTIEGFNDELAYSIGDYLDKADSEFGSASNKASDAKDVFFNLNSEKLKKLENDYYNYKLEEIVTKYYERNKILIHKNSIVQNIDPVYLDPPGKGFLQFRAHFFASSKSIFGTRMDTFYFNIMLVLLSTIPLFIALYYGLLGKFVSFIEKFRIRSQVFNVLVICFFIFLY